MNSTELRNILNISVPSSYQAGVLACDQLNLVHQQKFAIILNTDASTTPGLHWLGVFKKSAESPVVEFFDSFGLPTNFYDKQIGNFLSIFPQILSSSVQLQSPFSD